MTSKQVLSGRLATAEYLTETGGGWKLSNRLILCLRLPLRNLPAKSEEETQRHKLEYEEMVAGAKRRGRLTHIHIHMNEHTHVSR